MHTASTEDTSALIINSRNLGLSYQTKLVQSVISLIASTREYVEILTGHYTESFLTSQENRVDSLEVFEMLTAFDLSILSLYHAHHTE